MKIYIKILLLIVAFMTLQALKASALPVTSTFSQRYCRHHIDTLPDTDSLIIKLKAIDLTIYTGQVVDSFINHLPAGIVNYRIAGSGMKNATDLLVFYDQSVHIMIHIREWSHMNPNLVNTSTPEQNWNVSLARQEKIAFVIIYNGSGCINGCEKLPRYTFVRPSAKALTPAMSL